MVVAAPDFVLSPSPASLTINQSSQATSTITSTISGSFDASISLSSSGAPPGTTVTFNPPTIPAPGAGSSIMTVMIASNTPTGNYNLTVIGNGGGVQSYTIVMLTVVLRPTSPLGDPRLL